MEEAQVRIFLRLLDKLFKRSGEERKGSEQLGELNKLKATVQTLFEGFTL